MLTTESDEWKKESSPTGRNKRNFTLVELLVVVSVLVILLSLLLPALRQSIEKGRSVSCIGNLRQVGAGVLQYAESWNGYFTNRDSSARWANRGAYWSKISESLGGPSNEELANLSARPELIERIPKVFFCPSALYDPSTAEDANNAIVKTEYIYPFVFSEQNGGTMRLLEPVYRDVSVFPHRKCPPSAAAIGADGEAANHKEGLAANSANCLRNEGNQMQHAYLFPRHLGRSNLVFADGHVESWAGQTFPARKILRWSGVRDSEGRPLYDNAVIVNVTTWFDASRNFFINGTMQTGE